MRMLVYDESIQGFLSCIFYVYEHKIKDVVIRPESTFQVRLFGETTFVESDETKAQRVWDGLKTKLSDNSIKQFYRCFLSEQPCIEDHLLAYCRYAFSSRHQVDGDFTHPAVLMVNQLAKKVYREKHRMEAFVRFQLTADNIFYAVVEPDFNVLPLISKHFSERYADQQWLIYDLKRKYALYYDLHTVTTVQIDFSEQLSETNIQTISHENEALYQQLWQRYFKSVNIEARKNLKLHIRHMPKRYWRNLVEKQVGK